MLSKQARAYTEVIEASYHIINGVIVAIDPSVGSNSSMPGYAVYDAGKLVESGVFNIAPSGTLPERLTKLNYFMRKLLDMYKPSVLIYEEIPPQRYGGGNANAHASLLKSVGVILSISGPMHYVGFTPMSWKKMARSTYIKGDKEDAEEIGYIAYTQAIRLSEEKVKKTKSSYVSNKKKIVR